MVFWTIIFCLVCTLACYTLSRKKQNIIICGGTGSTWEICLLGHAEWVETRDLTLGNFDSCLTIKVTALSFSHMFV